MEDLPVGAVAGAEEEIRAGGPAVAEDRLEEGVGVSGVESVRSVRAKALLEPGSYHQVLQTPCWSQLLHWMREGVVREPLCARA